MARIRIEDLPPVEDLTQEELVEIFGAGRASFRPTFESLEGREMMDAALGNALSLPVAPPGVGHVRVTTPEQQQAAPLQIVTLSPSADVHASLEQMYRSLAMTSGQDLAPPHSMMPQAQGGLHPDYRFGDTQTLIERGQKFLNDTVIGSFDRWGLHRNVQFDSLQIDGDKIKLTFKVVYGVMGDSTCKIDLTFEGKDTGGVRAYTLSGAALRDWEGLPVVGKALQGQFEGVAKELFNKEVRTIECDRFDAKTAGDTASAIRRELLDRLRDFIGDKNIEAGTGGFRNVRIQKIDGGYQIDMSVTWPNFKEATVSFRFTGETVDPSSGRVRFDAKVVGYTPAPGQQDLSSFYQDGVCKDFSVQLNQGTMPQGQETNTAEVSRRYATLAQGAMAQGQQESPYAQSDAQEIYNKAHDFLLKKVITGGGNRWMLSNADHKYLGATVDENGWIKLTWQIQYGLLGGFGNAPTCKVELIFCGDYQGGVKVYELMAARLDGWKPAPFVGEGIGKQFDGKVRELFKQHEGKVEVRRFNENVFAQRVVEQLNVPLPRGVIWELGKVEPGKNSLRIQIFTESNKGGEMWLTFEFKDEQVAQGILKVANVQGGSVDFKLHQQLRATEFRLR